MFIKLIISFLFITSINLISDETVSTRRIQKHKNGWIPKNKRKRKVTTALKAYAALTTSASKGAVRVVD